MIPPCKIMNIQERVLPLIFMGFKIIGPWTIRCSYIKRIGRTVAEIYREIKGNIEKGEELKIKKPDYKPGYNMSGGKGTNIMVRRLVPFILSKQLSAVKLTYFLKKINRNKRT